MALEIIPPGAALGAEIRGVSVTDNAVESVGGDDEVGVRAQTFNVVIGSRARSATLGGRRFLAAKLIAENGRNILEGGDRDRDRATEDDFGGMDGGGVAWIGDGKPIVTFR